MTKNKYHLKNTVIVFLVTALILSCETRTDKNNKQKNTTHKIKKANNLTQTISTDINLLGKLLDLTTYKPIEVKFKFTFIDNSAQNDRISVPGPSDYYLEAILYFDSLTFVKIKDFEKNLEWMEQNYKKEEFNFEWLSNDLQNQLMNSNLDYHGHPDFFFGSGVNRKCWYLENKILIKTSSGSSY